MSMIINPPAAVVPEHFRTAIGPLDASADTLLADAGGYTVIAKYAPKFLQGGGSIVRLTLQGFAISGHAATINNVTVAPAASGNGAKAWDAAAAPVAVTFGGSDEIRLLRGSRHVSDRIAFTVDASKALLIAYNLAADAYASFVLGLGANNFVTYQKAGVQEAADQTRGPGYKATGGTSPFLLTLECSS